MNRLRRSFLVAIAVATLVPVRALAWDIWHPSTWGKKTPAKPPAPWGNTRVSNGSKGNGYNATSRLGGYDATRSRNGRGSAGAAKGRTVR